MSADPRTNGAPDPNAPHKHVAAGLRTANPPDGYVGKHRAPEPPSGGKP